VHPVLLTETVAVSEQQTLTC